MNMKEVDYLNAHQNDGLNMFVLLRSHKGVELRRYQGE